MLCIYGYEKHTRSYLSFFMRRYEKVVTTTYHVREDTILISIFSSQYTYNCTILPELRRATTNTCKQNNCANSHELCPPKKSIHVWEVGLETRGERQFTRLSPFPRRAVLVVHHSCTEYKATTRNLVAAPAEPSNAKALPETGTAVASVNSSKVATPEEPRSANTPGTPE